MFNLRKEKPVTLLAENIASDNNKKAILPKDYLFKTKHFLGILAIFLVLINSYFVIKMSNYLSRNEGIMEQKLVK